MSGKVGANTVFRGCIFTTNKVSKVKIKKLHYYWPYLKCVPVGGELAECLGVDFGSP